MVTRCWNKRFKYIVNAMCAIILAVCMLACNPKAVFASDQADISFEKEEYNADTDSEFKISVTLSSDTDISTYEIKLMYDDKRLKYISGAESEEDGVITLKGTGWGTEVSYDGIQFKAISSGSAGIYVKEAHIYSVEDNSELTVAGVNQYIPITVNGTDTDGVSFEESLTSTLIADENSTRYGIDSDVPILTSVNTNSQTLYLVDVAEYFPKMDVWDYQLEEGSFLGQNCTFLTNADQNIRALVFMDAEGEFYLYSVASDETIFPITEMKTADGTYYLTSVKAAGEVPDGIINSDEDYNTVVYALDETGIADFYKYAQDGTLVLAEDADSGEFMSDLTEFIAESKRMILGVCIVFPIALVLAFLIKKLVGNWSNVRKNVFTGERSQYFFVIRQLTGREIKRKYARSYLGILWSVLNPLLMMIVMSLIFSYMFKKSIQNFPLYYLTGSIIWTIFHDGTNHSMSALVDNKNLLLKTKLPRQVFIVSRMYTALVNFGFSLVPYFLLLIFFRVQFSWKMFLLPLDVVLIFLFSYGISNILSILYVFFADIKYLYGVLLRLLVYLCAIFYPVTKLPAKLQTIICYNPVYLAIYIARECMIYGRFPYYTAWVKLIIATAASLIVGAIVFKKYQNDVIQKI